MESIYSRNHYDIMSPAFPSGFRGGSCHQDPFQLVDSGRIPRGTPRNSWKTSRLTGRKKKDRPTDKHNQLCCPFDWFRVICHGHLTMDGRNHRRNPSLPRQTITRSVVVGPGSRGQVPEGRRSGREQSRKAPSRQIQSNRASCLNTNLELVGGS